MSAKIKYLSEKHFLLLLTSFVFFCKKFKEKSKTFNFCEIFCIFSQAILAKRLMIFAKKVRNEFFCFSPSPPSKWEVQSKDELSCTLRFSSQHLDYFALVDTKHSGAETDDVIFDPAVVHASSAHLVPRSHVLVNFRCFRLFASILLPV